VNDRRTVATCDTRVMRGHGALRRIKTGRSSHGVGRGSRRQRSRTVPWICDR